MHRFGALHDDELKRKNDISFHIIRDSNIDESAKVEVARSGDLAYNWGTGRMTVKDKRGKITATTFKSASVSVVFYL